MDLNKTNFAILLRNFINEKDEIISKIENDCKNHQNENKSILKENERLKELESNYGALKAQSDSGEKGLEEQLSSYKQIIKELN